MPDLLFKSVFQGQKTGVYLASCKVGGILDVQSCQQCSPSLAVAWPRPALSNLLGRVCVAQTSQKPFM